MQWLTIVGPVLWDFEKVRMEFTYKNKKRVLRGSYKATIQCVNCKALKRRVDKYAQLFAIQIQPLGQQPGDLCEI